jgi:hypothetical protein
MMLTPKRQVPDGVSATSLTVKEMPSMATEPLEAM